MGGQVAGLDELNLVLSKFDFDKGRSLFVCNQLKEMRDVDLETFEHSLRVGYKMMINSDFFKLNKGLAFTAGVLHDIGKMDISRDVLLKTGEYDDDDWAEMRKHPYFSYERLKDYFPISAEIAHRHHTRQGSRNYPERMSDVSSKVLGVGINSYIDAVARFDFEDASNSRKHGKYSGTIRKKNCLANSRARRGKNIFVNYPSYFLT